MAEIFEVNIYRHKNDARKFKIEFNLARAVSIPEIIWKGIIRRIDSAIYFLQTHPETPQYTINLCDEFSVGG